MLLLKLYLQGGSAKITSNLPLGNSNIILGNDIVIALDSTGIKITNRGEWLPHKWNVRKGYLKIHVAVDIKKRKIVSLEVTSEEIHDGSRLKNLVDNALENNTLKIVIADGAYDSKENFRYLYDNNIEAAIKVRKNSSYRFMGCNPRRKVVLQQLKNLEKWKSSVSYGQRWIVESVFSCMKRMFGEYVSARRFPNMVKVHCKKIDCKRYHIVGSQVMQHCSCKL